MQKPIFYLNSNDGTSILAFGAGPSLRHSGAQALETLQTFIDSNKDAFIFGNLSYDLKDQLFEIKSSHPDLLSFPDLFFCSPKYVVKLYKEHIEFLQGSKDPECLEFLNEFMEEETDQNYHHYPFNFESRISRDVYLDKVRKLQKHIQRGDIYEVNFCQEYFAENVQLDYPLDTYFKLNTLTKAPFSSFVQFDEFSIFCGSPERFLKKEGTKLISQPIKGTAPRSLDPIEDEQLKENLRNDPKERSENVMIVDLVRNDFSRIAEKNSVAVDELFGIYSFETVHQMISTVSCEIDDHVSFTDMLRATYPMGSMTGAPKLRAMQLIEEQEDFKRGLYSGSIGYIKPNGDFDFNVVIRSLLYNAENKYLSCSVGSAITIASVPEKEYDECQVKVQRILTGMNE